MIMANSDEAARLLLMDAFKKIYMEHYLEKVNLEKRLEESKQKTISRQVKAMIETVTTKPVTDDTPVIPVAQDNSLGISEKLWIQTKNLEGHKQILSDLSNDLQNIIASHQLEETIVG